MPNQRRSTPPPIPAFAPPLPPAIPAGLPRAIAATSAMLAERWASVDYHRQSIVAAAAWFEANRDGMTETHAASAEAAVMDYGAAVLHLTAEAEVIGKGAIDAASAGLAHVADPEKRAAIERDIAIFEAWPAAPTSEVPS